MKVAYFVLFLLFENTLGIRVKTRGGGPISVADLEKYKLLGRRAKSFQIKDEPWVAEFHKIFQDVAKAKADLTDNSDTTGPYELALHSINCAYNKGKAWIEEGYKDFKKLEKDFKRLEGIEQLNKLLETSESVFEI
eukprot:Platyproteum_vivax@DN14736_c0_g1_i1.p1